MDLYLQMGHGMLSLAKDLIENWGETQIIFGAVNEKENNIEKHANDLIECGAKIAFDPQLFNPKECKEKLKKYKYWPKNNELLNDIENVSANLYLLNDSINSDFIILPGIETDENNIHESLQIIKKSLNYFRKKTNKKVFATVCLFPNTLRNQEFLELTIEELKKIDVDGFYVLPNSPNNEYIISDSVWMTGMLKLLTCLKMFKKTVIVGYCNHQSLIYSLAKVDAICSGNYLNTRCFDPKKFRDLDNGVQQRNTWYYLPSALNEYNIALVELATGRFDTLDFKPLGSYINKYSQSIFTDNTIVNYNETSSFKHYLHCLRQHCKTLKYNNYSDTYNAYDMMLKNAEAEIMRLKGKGYYGGSNRDFMPAFYANRSAMTINNNDYGIKLEFEWKNL